MITFVNLMCKGNTISPTTQFVEAEFTKRGNNVRFLKFTFAFRYIIIFASNKNTYMKKIFLLILCLMPLSLLAQTYKM